MGAATPIVIVTGPPASGKTTIARRIAATLELPLVAKDEFKEILYEALGAGDVEWSRRLGIATYPLLYHVVELLLAAGRPCVLEANFASREAVDGLARLHARRPFRALQVSCSGDVDALTERYRARASTRHRGHLDSLRADEVREAITGGATALPVPGEVVEVDTTRWEAVSVDELTERARRWVAT